MLILGIPYAGAVSAFVAVTALVPIFGAWIGGGFGAFLILLAEPGKALWFILFLIVLQQVEGNLIYPKVVGKSVGLPGLLGADGCYDWRRSIRHLRDAVQCSRLRCAVQPLSGVHEESKYPLSCGLFNKDHGNYRAYYLR